MCVQPHSGMGGRLLYVPDGRVGVAWRVLSERTGVVTSERVITDHDVRALLDVFDRRGLAADHDIFYADVLLGLRELIPCDEITFQLMDIAQQRSRGLDVTADGVQRWDLVGGANDEWQQLYWERFWEEDGRAGPLTTGDYCTVLHQAEIWGRGGWAKTPLGSSYAARGLKDDILCPLVPLDGIDRRIAFWRTQEMPYFSERETAMVALVRPHVAELHVRRDRELRGVPRLTPRQWEVLRQVAKGAGNIQIARSLRVSEATVAKHLENVFMRLGVQSRTEAVAAVLAFLDAA